MDPLAHIALGVGSKGLFRIHGVSVYGAGGYARIAYILMLRNNKPERLLLNKNALPYKRCPTRFLLALFPGFCGLFWPCVEHCCSK